MPGLLSAAMRRLRTAECTPAETNYPAVTGPHGVGDILQVTEILSYRTISTSLQASLHLQAAEMEYNIFQGLDRRSPQGTLGHGSRGRRDSSDEGCAHLGGTGGALAVRATSAIGQHNRAPYVTTTAGGRHMAHTKINGTRGVEWLLRRRHAQEQSLSGLSGEGLTAGSPGASRVAAARRVSLPRGTVGPLLMVPVAAPHARFLRSGEGRLLIAVLADAVHCFQRYEGARDRHGQSLFALEDEWIHCRDDPSPLSFENICAVLNLDADYIRGGLDRLRAADAAVKHEKHSAARYRPHGWRR